MNLSDKSTGQEHHISSPTAQGDTSDYAESASTAAHSEKTRLSKIKLVLVLAAVTLVAFLMLLDISIIVTAIPSITTDFHTLSDIGWYGNAYLIASCSLQLLTGRLYAQFSLKATFLTFLAIFEVGSAVCGSAQSSKMLIIGRVVAGVGASGISNGTLTIVSTVVPVERMPAVLGMVMSISHIGIVCGPLIGGAFTEYATWRWCFLINLPIGFAAAVLIIFVEMPKRSDRLERRSLRTTLSELDLPGFSIFAASSVMFLMALEWGRTKYRWNSAVIICLFAGSGVALAIFVVWEHLAGEKAMIPAAWAKNKIVLSSCLFIWFLFGTQLIFSYYLPIYFQTAKNASPLMSGVYILPGIGGHILMAPISGFLVQRWGYYLPWAVASAIFTAISCGLVSTFTPTTSSAKWIIYQFLGGIGRGSGLPIPVLAVQRICSKEHVSTGMAVIVFSQTFGGAILLTVAATLFNQGLIDGLHEYAPSVPVQTVVATGASGVRSAFKPDNVAGILKAYSLAINHCFYLAAGAAIGVFVCSWGMGWYSIKKKDESEHSAL